jgi:hypothetical protein
LQEYIPRIAVMQVGLYLFRRWFCSKIAAHYGPTMQSCVLWLFQKQATAK